MIFFSVVTSHNWQPDRSLNKVRLFLVLYVRWRLLMISLGCWHNLCHCFILQDVPSMHFQFINSSAHRLHHLPSKIPECFRERCLTVMVTFTKHVHMLSLHQSTRKKFNFYSWYTTGKLSDLSHSRYNDVKSLN